MEAQAVHLSAAIHAGVGDDQRDAKPEAHRHSDLPVRKMKAQIPTRQSLDPGARIRGGDSQKASLRRPISKLEEEVKGSFANRVIPGTLSGRLHALRGGGSPMTVPEGQGHGNPRIRSGGTGGREQPSQEVRGSERACQKGAWSDSGHAAHPQASVADWEGCLNPSISLKADIEDCRENILYDDVQLLAT